MTDADGVLREYPEDAGSSLKEALSDILGAEAHFYRMTLKSKEYELFDFSMFVESEDGNAPEPVIPGVPEDALGEEILWRLMSATKKNPVSEEYEMSLDAGVAIGDGGATAVYAETNDDGGINLTEIHFSTDDAGLITIIKSGEAETVMTFERGRRHRAVYHTPYMDFDMRLFAARVENTFTPGVGGEIHLDYALEIRGAAAHRTVMTMKFEPEEI